MDFLSTAVWLWDFLILTLLPTISVILAAVFLLKIMDEAPEAIGRYTKGVMDKFRRTGGRR